MNTKRTATHCNAKQSMQKARSEGRREERRCEGEREEADGADGHKSVSDYCLTLVSLSRKAALLAAFRQSHHASLYYNADFIVRLRVAQRVLFNQPSEILD